MGPGALEVCPVPCGVGERRPRSRFRSLAWRFGVRPDLRGEIRRHCGASGVLDPLRSLPSVRKPPRQRPRPPPLQSLPVAALPQSAVIAFAVNAGRPSSNSLLNSLARFPLRLDIGTSAGDGGRCSRALGFGPPSTSTVRRLALFTWLFDTLAARRPSWGAGSLCSPIAWSRVARWIKAARVPGASTPFVGGPPPIFLALGSVSPCDTLPRTETTPTKDLGLTSSW